MGTAHVWAQQDARSALRWSESIPSNYIRREVASKIVSQWSNRDPEQAASLCGLFPHRSQSSVPHSNRNQSVGYQNPVDALQWVGEVATGEIYDRVVPALIKQIAQKSPLAAADFIDQLHSGTVRQEAISWVTSTWASQDLEAALDWIDSIQGIDDYSAALRSFSQLWIKLDLESMIEFARDLEPGELQSDFYEQIVNRLSRENLNRALSWAQNIDPDSPSRQHSMKTVFSYLANENPTRAARYIEDLDDLNLTRMLADTDTVAVIWGKNNPIEAVQWAEELPSERGGREATTTVRACSWLHHDPSTHPSGSTRSQIERLATPLCGNSSDRFKGKTLKPPFSGQKRSPIPAYDSICWNTPSVSGPRETRTRRRTLSGKSV